MQRPVQSYQIPSVTVLSNLELEEHKSCAARDDKGCSNCKRKKVTKTCFLLSHSFHLQKTMSPKQCYVGTEVVLPDQPVITWMTRYSTFSSLAQITWTAMGNPQNPRYTWSATGVSHRSVQVVLLAITAINPIGKRVDSRNSQRDLQRRIMMSISFPFKPAYLRLCWQTSVLPFKYFGRFREEVHEWGNLFLTTCYDFDLPFH